MILAGIKLTLLGMGVVVLFLFLLILVVNISFRFLARQSEKEFEDMRLADLRRHRKFTPAEKENVLVAVISAAIAAHRRRTG